MPFRDRADAGRRLASVLAGRWTPPPVVLALPRGGVPVAYEIAIALDASLDLILVRKLGVPSQPELAMGAIGEDGVEVRNDDVVRAASVTPEQFAVVEQRERTELTRRARRFRGDRAAVPIEGRQVVLVDDGLATGATARAALRVVRARAAADVTLAVPVAPPDTVDSLRVEADDVVALEAPRQMFAIGAFYRDFSQTTDDEVVALLDRAARRGPG